MTAFNNNLGANGNGLAALYSKDQTGQVVAQSSNAGFITPAVSQNQYLAISGLAVLSSNGSTYDVILNDNSYQPGRILGGKHAGEPILIPQPPPATATPVTGLAPAFNTTFPSGPSGGAIRSTYQNAGISVDIIYRARTN